MILICELGFLKILSQRNVSTDKAVEIHFENIESPVLLKMAEWVSLDESLTFDNNFPQHMQ